MKTTLLALAGAALVFGVVYSFGMDVSHRGFDLGFTLLISVTGAVMGIWASKI